VDGSAVFALVLDDAFPAGLAVLVGGGLIAVVASCS